jgi:predicted nucleotidyltransferase
VSGVVTSNDVNTSQFSPSLEQLIRALAPVFAAHPAIAGAYLFGSVARGEAGPESDLDVGLVYRQRGGADHTRIASELAAQLGRASGREAIDVVDLEAQGPIFCHRVLCEGRLLYVADAARRVDFESETIVRALDFRPTYDLATQGKPAALRRWLRERYDLRTGSVKA